MLRLGLSLGVLLYIGVVDERLLITQNHRRKGTKKVNFQKTTSIAPANNKSRSTETNSYS